MLLPAACAPGTAIYDKPNVSYAEWRRDHAECRSQAGEGRAAVVDRGAYADCMRARGYRVN